MAIPTQPAWPVGTPVVHGRFGLGEVEVDRGSTVLVRFGQQYQSCERSTLEPRQTVDQAIAALAWNEPVAAITKAQASAITSLNDSWGIFSRSRINLLPHQLWVCHRVLRRWPARWLIADDVGLGKTIEAGLILWPLLSKGLVRRLLVLCPAKLVEQWQYRLNDMFDIRLHRYMAELDTTRSDYWNSHSQVVASLHTVRDDRDGRHDRLLSAERWDLVIVDEAHHLNSDEKTGKTLGYELLEQLLEHDRVESCVFFTGTPHRGKQYGFWSLLRLLRPELFDPERPDEEQYQNLPEVLIRNNKQSVTDMQGKKLFAPIVQHPETYRYSPQEEHFYCKLTEFIETGRAYASSLSLQGGQEVILVLIAMQKLASSSVAAIRRAIERRLERLRLHSTTNSAKPDFSALRSVDADLLDELQPTVEQVAAEPDPAMVLMKDEILHLEQLLEAAAAVIHETKIEQLIAVVESRYSEKQVLFFTEYKATQALVMSALQGRYGDGCVTFINGDEALDGVVSRSGEVVRLRESRTHAAERFNAGKARFLVSTEAGGEGIDLQHRCHSLIHVDLPWNPMRLHQRVGRLNRYGQEHSVEVVTLRNPDTVESRIWDKLNEKLRRIMLTLGNAMEEPEDLLQLVLGMAGSAIFDELFIEGTRIKREQVSDWFDSKSGTFGGQAAMDAVRALVGHAAKFDYQGLGDIPKTDLPALRGFFENALRANGRKPMWREDVLSFVTPEAWLADRGVRRKYEGLVFSRSNRREDVIGVGHRAFDQAVRQALESAASLAAVRGLALPTVLFQIYDEVTEHSGPLQSFTAGVTVNSSESTCQLMNDFELLEMLNSLSVSRSEPSPTASDDITVVTKLADTHVRLHLVDLKLPFVKPSVRLQLVLWPAAATSRRAET
jgi:superfamily II DNA or RNA helicase